MGLTPFTNSGCVRVTAADQAHTPCPGGVIVSEMGVHVQPDQKRVSPPVSLGSGDSTLSFSGAIRLIAHQPGSAGGYVTATLDEASLQESRGKR